jgi:hypothetical protein
MFLTFIWIIGVRYGVGHENDENDVFKNKIKIIKISDFFKIMKMTEKCTFLRKKISVKNTLFSSKWLSARINELSLFIKNSKKEWKTVFFRGIEMALLVILVWY